MEKGIVRKPFFTAIALLLAGLTTAGCAQVHKQFQHLVHPVYFHNVEPVPSGVTAGIYPTELAIEIKGFSRRAVLIPFAEYSTNTCPVSHSQHQRILHDSVTKALHKKGMESVIGGEGVNRFLLDNGVIVDAAPILHKESPRTSALLREIEEGEWSPEMVGRLGNSAHRNITTTGVLKGKFNTRLMDKHAVQDIGAAFEADYVIRGRITVYQSGLKWQESPTPDQVLAFYFAGGETGLPMVCISDLEAYEWFEYRPIVPSPREISSEKRPAFKKDSQQFYPLLRLDLFIQETVKGGVVFAKSAETQVSHVYTMSRPSFANEVNKYLERVIPLTVGQLFSDLN